MESITIPKHHPAFPALRWTTEARSSDPARPSLAGLFSEEDGTIMATDGKRVHFATRMPIWPRGLYTVTSTAQVIVLAPNKQTPVEHWRKVAPKEDCRAELLINFGRKDSARFSQAYTQMVLALNAFPKGGEETDRVCLDIHFLDPFRASGEDWTARFYGKDKPVKLTTGGPNGIQREAWIMPLHV